MKTYWGYHLILDCSNCCPKAIRSKQNITDFSKYLVKRIDMVAYGEPQVQHFGSGNKAGYTLVQLIETSNICAHFVEETNDMYLDVFSCKPFNIADVDETVKIFFRPTTKNLNYLTRQAPYVQIENGNKTPKPELK